MQSCNYIPHLPLCKFVDYFWFVEGWDLPHTRERLFPSARMELVIDLSENKALQNSRGSCSPTNKLQTPILSGAYSESSIIEIAPLSCMIGIQFKPGGSFPFFNPPADELHNKRVALTDLWGMTALKVQEQLLAAPTVDACFHLLEQILLAQTVKILKLHPAVVYALDEFQQTSSGYAVADVVAQTGLSSRRFIQLFREQVGLTPKLFCRIQRFQQSLEAIAREKEIKWISVANACGYFDQAHFINEFRAFSGLNPTAYLTQRGENPNHLPLFD